MAVRVQLQLRLGLLFAFVEWPPGSVSISEDRWNKTKGQGRDAEGRGSCHGRRPQAQERYQGHFLRLSESYLTVGFMPSARGLRPRVRRGSSPLVASPGSLGHVSPA